MTIDPTKLLGSQLIQGPEKARPQPGKSAASGKAESAFGEFLAEALDKPSQAAASAPPPPAGGLNPLLNPALMGLEAAQVSQASKTSQIAETLAPGDGQLSATEVENLLSAWDEYAATLGKGGDLKGLWGRLENISGTVAQLKRKAGDDPAVSPLLQELEILAATERFKFNRGDYL